MWFRRTSAVAANVAAAAGDRARKVDGLTENFAAVVHNSARRYPRGFAQSMVRKHGLSGLAEFRELAGAAARAAKASARAPRGAVRSFDPASMRTGQIEREHAAGGACRGAELLLTSAYELLSHACFVARGQSFERVLRAVLVARLPDLIAKVGRGPAGALTKAAQSGAARAIDVGADFACAASVWMLSAPTAAVLWLVKHRAKRAAGAAVAAASDIAGAQARELLASKRGDVVAAVAAGLSKLPDGACADKLVYGALVSFVQFALRALGVSLDLRVIADLLRRHKDLVRDWLVGEDVSLRPVVETFAASCTNDASLARLVQGIAADQVRRLLAALERH